MRGRGRRRWGHKEREGRGKGQWREGGINDVSGTSEGEEEGRGHGGGRGMRDDLNNSGHWIRVRERGRYPSI